MAPSPKAAVPDLGGAGGASNGILPPPVWLTEESLAAGHSHCYVLILQDEDEEERCSGLWDWMVGRKRGVGCEVSFRLVPLKQRLDAVLGGLKDGQMGGGTRTRERVDRCSCRIHGWTLGHRILLEGCTGMTHIPSLHGKNGDIVSWS